MRIMYDAVTARNIPRDAAIVAGYDDGRYRWSASDWALFPNAIHVHIAVYASTNSGHVLDVESGDATPLQAPGWAQRRRYAGTIPTVYCSAAVWPTVYREFVRQRVQEPEWWIAAYPGIGPYLYPGTVAHQYADPGPYDISVVAPFWPGVDSFAPPTPQPPTPEPTTEIMAVPTIIPHPVDPNRRDYLWRNPDTGATIHEWWNGDLRSGIEDLGGKTNQDPTGDWNGAGTVLRVHVLGVPPYQNQMFTNLLPIDPTQPHSGWKSAQTG